MDSFWNLESSIIEVVSQKIDKSEILIQTTSQVEDPLQTFNNEIEFIKYSNSNNFQSLDELALLIFYSSGCDDQILRGELTERDVKK